MTVLNKGDNNDDLNGIENRPFAIYYNIGEAIEKRIEVGDGPHFTKGKTSGPSDFVLKAGIKDKDKPSEAKDSCLGKLRSELTTLQDKINVYLTERMASNSSGNNNEEAKFEKEILDGTAEDDEDEY
ncbi:chromatin DNA-binding EKC/KEOPS complex subunit GON7 [Ascoidea rubescens DSM 1968]|uniref:EKC/KEOPS complex subunit GON7 n=1 Tax=Ascoidea rubescens DSM 1968 TaxID=1344418 RepID=A0A1D2VN65_9ASCO|nr:Gon7-domain-containing protein [Ascoidea rubescens DSM 1968]ODV63017.1 Gon7-domain-containing protein [Ascoidea rubescens DSM 1968]